MLSALHWKTNASKWLVDIRGWRGSELLGTHRGGFYEICLFVLLLPSNLETQAFMIFELKFPNRKKTNKDKWINKEYKIKGGHVYAETRYHI